MSRKEKSHEVIDELKAKPDDTAPEAETADVAEAEAPAEAAEEPSVEDVAAGLPPVDVYSLLRSFIGLLGAQAWQWMGLIKDPSTGKIEKDMAQAKVAIDAVAALMAQIEAGLSPSESEELRAMLSDLRINFVRQS